MSELTVIGTEFLDIIRIIKDKKYIEKIIAGGIQNIEQGKKIALNTGIANFIINRYGSESVSKINKVNTLLSQLYSKEYDWVHLAYVDTCDIDLSKVKAKVKSCDITNDNWFVVGTEKIVNNIQQCDYVFMDKNEHKFLVSKIQNGILPYKGWLILHDSQGSDILKANQETPPSSGGWLPTIDRKWEKKFEYRHEKKNFLYTVGAGDKFAGHFIEARMSGLEISECQKLAHEKVLLWLKEVNEKL